MTTIKLVHNEMLCVLCTMCIMLCVLKYMVEVGGDADRDVIMQKKKRKNPITNQTPPQTT